MAENLPNPPPSTDNQPSPDVLASLLAGSPALSQGGGNTAPPPPNSQLMGILQGIAGKLPAKAQQNMAQQQQIGDRQIQDVTAARQNTLKDMAQPNQGQEILPPPPSQSFRSPLEAFSSIFPALAMLGSARSKHPAIAAAKSATAAMDAFHKGDKEKLDLELQNWQNQVKTIVDNNKIYKDIKDMKSNELEALLSQDTSMAAAYARQNGYAGMTEYADIISKLNDQVSKSYYDMMKARSLGGATLSFGAVDTYATAILNGVKPSSLGLGYGNNPNKTAVLNRVSEMDPNFDMAAAELEYGGVQKGVNTLGTSGAKISLAAESLDKAIPLARAAAKNVDLSQFKDINALENYARSHTGDKNLEQLLVALKTASTDYSSLIARNGQATDSTRSAANELINENMSRGQLDGFFEQVEKEKDAQLSAVKAAKQDVLGKGQDKTPEPSQQDIDFTAKKYGISTDEVKKRLGL